MLNNFQKVLKYVNKKAITLVLGLGVYTISQIFFQHERRANFQESNKNFLRFLF